MRRSRLWKVIGGRVSVRTDDAGATAVERTSSLLLIEDDPGDALLVSELIRDGAPGLHRSWVRSLAEASAVLAVETPACILLDLNLPDAQGLQALAKIRERTDAPVVVMTGLDEQRTGLAAVTAGAQDYLVKGRVDAELFGRSVRYAIERKQAERAAVALHASQMRDRENARLERGLLPTPLLRPDDPVEVTTRYRPSRNALLGGDFYDVVADDTGVIHAVVGDVSGHGPDAAATGVALRLAWRTLVFSGITGVSQLRLLERILLAERGDRRIFATASCLAMDPGSGRVQILRAGHPDPMLFSPTGTRWLGAAGGPALGFVPGRAEWPVTDVTLPPGNALMVFTDGLFEGRVNAAGDRLGEDGLLALADAVRAEGRHPVVDELIARVERLAAAVGGLDDDLAVVHLRRRSGGECP
jgi:serine phosphatase RsbU (regulator of sigma subunit)